MPGKLYPEDLATRIRERGGGPYQPSNGEEGMEFHALWCEQCKRGERFRTGKGEDCDILSNSFVGEIPEWTHDAAGQPCCTAFEAEET